MLLTWNEEANIGACLTSIARQKRRDFEVIVVDAASTDRTMTVLRYAKSRFPVPLRIEAAKRRLPIGEARNLGVSMARAPYIAFLSADAELEPGWIDEALASMKRCDMVFGRQVHAPNRWTIGAAVRGLRYHFPAEDAPNPYPFASNVAAAYKREILLGYPFDPWANAAEDLLLAQRARASGYRAEYNPRMVVRHHDVASARQEMRKSVREGRGWGTYSHELGLFQAVLAWGAALAFTTLVFLVLPSLLSLFLLMAVLWMPALRRALTRRHAMPKLQIVKGTAASPLFDVAFLVSYLGGLAGRNRAEPPPRHEPKESQA